MMRLGITSKLFIAILATSITVAIAMGLAVRVSFTHGFLGYLNEQELARAESLMPRLTAAYKKYGSWDFLRQKPRRLFWLFRPQDVDFSEIARERFVALSGPPLSDLTGFNLRVAVLDAERKRVAGNPQAGDDSILRPIVVEGATVGWSTPGGRRAPLPGGWTAMTTVL